MTITQPERRNSHRDLRIMLSSNVLVSIREAALVKYNGLKDLTFRLVSHQNAVVTSTEQQITPGGVVCVHTRLILSKTWLHGRGIPTQYTLLGVKTDGLE